MRSAIIVLPLWWLAILASLSAYDSGYVTRAWHDIVHTMGKR